jgi:Holliday junction DNA helicase RuvA
VRDLPRARLALGRAAAPGPAHAQGQARLIGRLSGKLAAKNPPQVLVDVGGVAYELDVPMSTFYALPATGEAVMLFTHLVVREDAHSLYGFATGEERAVFRQLIRIAGIGARTALAVLSGMSVGDLAQAVALQDAGRLVRIPGIGKKTAERLLLELKGKLAEGVGGPPSERGSEVLHALVALGYSEKEALAAVKALAPDMPLAEAIRAALKNLVRR